MKAKIKATGQIIELFPYVYDVDGNDFLLDEVELLDNYNWQQVRIDAAIKLTCELSEKMLGAGYSERQIVKQAVELADALVAELKHSEDVYAECRRLAAINTASVCENMTKIQKELQKKGGNDENPHRHP